MSLALLMSTNPSRENFHRSTPKSTSAEAYLCQLSQTWRESLPYQSTVPAYISPEFRAYGDYIPQGITYAEYILRAQSNVFSIPHLKYALGEIRATVDSKARRADVYILSWIHGFGDGAGMDVRRPGVTVLKWQRSGEEWLLYEHVGITGTYGVFDDP